MNLKTVLVTTDSAVGWHLSIGLSVTVNDIEYWYVEHCQYGENHKGDDQRAFGRQEGLLLSVV